MVVSYVLISDLARYYCVIVALWLVALLIRMIAMRIREHGWTGKAVPHPFSILGTVTLLLIAIVRRFDTLGKPGDAYLWTALFGVTCLLAGVLINNRFDFTPPWRRGKTGSGLTT